MESVAQKLIPSGSALLVLSLALSLSVALPPSVGALPGNLHGNINVTGVSSEQDTITTQSVNQEYSVYWSKNVTQWVKLRSALRFNYLGVDRTASDNAWRRRFLPSVDLIWSHPIFDFSASWLRQETRSNNDLTDLVRNSYGVQWKSRLLQYPIISLRFDRDETFNDNNLALRDTRDNRFQATADYSRGRSQYYYNFSIRDNLNRPTSVKVTDISNLFRWNRTSTLFDDRVRVATGYSFSQRRSSTDVGRDTTVLDPIAIVRAIYAEDASPEQGSLSDRSGLSDGNVDTPVQPLIDLGQSQLTHNIGVDFGFRRRVDGIYIYTDRPSGESVSWQVYTSSDNSSWDFLGTGVDESFNSNFNRYEILFPMVDTRYIKVVSGGINEVTTVYVTEIVPLVQLTDEEVIKRTQTSHQADLSTTYFVSKKVTTTLDITYEAEPGSDFSNNRDQLYYSMSLTHEVFSTLTQSVKLQSGFEKFHLTGVRNDNRDLFYTLLYEPLSTLNFSLSAISRTNIVDNIRSSEINNLHLQTNGRVLETLNLSGEIGFSRNNRYDSQTRFDSWTYRVTGDVALLRSLHTTSSYLYQTTGQNDTDSTRVRQQYSVSGTWRVTRAVLVRGQYTVNLDEQQSNTYEELAANWSASRKLSFGALYTLIESEDGNQSERINGRAALSISARTSLYFNYNSTEFTLGDRPRVDAFQIGIRSGF